MKYERAFFVSSNGYDKLNDCSNTNLVIDQLNKSKDLDKKIGNEWKNVNFELRICFILGLLNEDLNENSNDLNI